MISARKFNDGSIYLIFIYQGLLQELLNLKDKYVTRLKAADIELGSLNKYEELLIGLKNLNVMASRRPLRFRAETCSGSGLIEIL